MLLDITNWDDAYSNGKYIPGSETIVDEWNTDARQYRENVNKPAEIAYGDRDREVFDLFMPQGKPKGLAVFIHGGYWLDFDKSSWSHLAAGCVEQGWATCLPSYDLCPTIRIAGITRQIGRAITKAAEMVDGPIHITGHSAGGHLAVRMGCANTPLEETTLRRIGNIVGISGLYDLNPLMATSMNRLLKIDEQEAANESPALLEPATGIHFTSWVGSIERPEFIRQSKLLKTAWRKHNMPVNYVEAEGLHHFNVIAPLSDRNSALIQTLLA